MATEIIAYLLMNYEEQPEDKIVDSSSRTLWTLADLFIRQYLNNGCDGFGLKNVKNVFEYLIKKKDDLIKFNLVSKDGYNNSGYPLWKDFAFEDISSVAEFYK